MSNKRAKSMHCGKESRLRALTCLFWEQNAAVREYGFAHLRQLGTFGASAFVPDLSDTKAYNCH